MLPNAGLPQNVGGRAVYLLTPEELAEYHRRFITEYGVRIVGGCCGTTPEHLKAVVEACADLDARAPRGEAQGGGVERVHRRSRSTWIPSR